VVDSEPVGNGSHALKYLAPYVTRGCVADWRVTQCTDTADLNDAALVLQVKRSGTRKYKPLTLSVTEFIRRWLQHVVPGGFHRVRHYGFLNGSSRRSNAELQLLIAVALGRLYYLLSTEQIVQAQPTKMRCDGCGGPMVSLGYTPPPTEKGRAPP
jgi:hypothetical protein